MALDPTRGKAAASSNLRDFGLRAVLITLALVNSAKEPDPPPKTFAEPYTSSPTLKSVTPSPTLLTAPAKSPPKVAGKFKGIKSFIYPARTFQSKGLMLAA